MSEKTLTMCRGLECPNRGQCRHYLLHAANPGKASVGKCPGGKWFERALLDHPQMNFPRGC